MNGGLYNLSYTYRDRDATYTTTQVSRLSYTRSGATTLNFDYTYDTLGNIKTYKAPSKTAITYTYDNQGQLTKAAGAKTYTYTHDSVGNILTAFDGTDEHTYTYGDSDWHDKLMKFDGQSITYDASGNPTSYYNGTRWTFGWSNGRNLTSATGGGKTISYTYDLQDGTRATKTVDGKLYTYIYAGGKLLRQIKGNNLDNPEQVLDFLYDVNGRPYAMVVNETTTYHYITNLQGDVINVVNSSGTAVASYEYDPYGNPVVENETALGFTNPLRYRGYYWDAETEMYLCGSRYYDPEIGRFINADSVDLLGANGDFASLNLFAYCGNNPVSRADSNGHFWNTVIGAVAGAIVGGVSAALSGTDITAGIVSGALSGAISGAAVDIAIATGGVGLVALAGVALASGAGGAASSYVNQRMNGRSHDEVDWGTVAIDGVWGAIGGALSFGTADVGGKMCKTLAENLALKGKAFWSQAASDFATTITIAAGTWLNGTKMNLLREGNATVASVY